MKKKRFRNVIALCLCAGLVVATTVSALAAPFVPSVTNKGGPEAVIAEDEKGEDILDEIIITGFGDRNQLVGYKKEQLEKGHDSVDPTILAGQIGSVDPDKLAVTDIFDISEREDKGVSELPVTITLNTGARPGTPVWIFTFVGDEWQQVPCTVNDNGTVTFVMKAFGPYCIVRQAVAEDGTVLSPQTGYDDL